MDHLAHNGPRRPFEKMNPGSRLPLNGRGRSKPLRRGRKSANECHLPPISRPMRGQPRQYGVCGMGCWELEEGMIKPHKISRWTEVKCTAFSWCCPANVTDNVIQLWQVYKQLLSLSAYFHFSWQITSSCRWKIILFNCLSLTPAKTTLLFWYQLISLKLVHPQLLAGWDCPGGEGAKTSPITDKSFLSKQTFPKMVPIVFICQMICSIFYQTFLNQKMLGMCSCEKVGYSST